MTYLLFALLAASPLSTLLEKAVANGDVAGVVALVISGDRVVYHEALGKQDVGRDIPMVRDSIFYIASMTKPITSVAAMMLVDEGKLGLGDPVEKYLPDFHPQVITDVDLAAGTYRLRTPVRPVTIRDLMTHTSGIGYDWSDPRAALVEKKTGSALTTLLHDPGERWTYGEGTTVLGHVVEKVSGQPLDQFFTARVFGPLGRFTRGEEEPKGSRRPLAIAVQKVGTFPCGKGWHLLRHSFASHCISAGYNPREVQVWMGHSTIEMTERYAHLAPTRGSTDRLSDPRLVRFHGTPTAPDDGKVVRLAAFQSTKAPVALPDLVTGPVFKTGGGR